MKEIIQALAKYSASVDQSLFELLKPLKKEQMMMQTKAYYPSIFDTLLHVFISDLNWCKRYGGLFKGSKAFTGGLLSLDDKTLRKEFESDHAKLFRYTKEADNMILQFVQELGETQLDSVITYKNNRGEEIRKELWKTLLQCFNHQTHHRGQISVFLDMMGVENDYSSTLARI